ncbi:MAG: Hsp20/alpha crystallin family protein [Saprospiraceae bacterium]|nr:Hsp20/alpha crystallin family protein [Saprospiraceae bacterium]
MCNRQFMYANGACESKRAFRGFGRHPHHRRRWTNRWSPPVNVQELDDHYELLLFAPGFQKRDFQVKTRDKVLVIGLEPEESTTSAPNWLRREFSSKGFERKFELNDNVDTEKISAKYEDGILYVTLPKLPGFETTRQEIEVL